MPSIEEEMKEVARAAIEAGKRRKDLALAVAATSASSDSSGKRSSKSMAPTPSTQVTPEPKQLHTETPPVEPRTLEFGTTGDNGVDEPEMVPDETLVDPSTYDPHLHQDAQPRDDLPPLPSMRSPSIHDGSGDVVMEPNLPEPEPAEPPVTATDPPAIAPEPPVTVPPTEVSLGSVATGLESGFVTPKGTSKRVTSGEQQNGEIRFAPVTAAGISAFFAAIRRPNTQVSFTTQGSQDMESTQQPAPEGSQDVAAAPAQETVAPATGVPMEVAPATEVPMEVAPATEVPIPPAATTPTPVVGATPKPDETVVGTAPTPKLDETVLAPPETVVGTGPTQPPPETVVGTGPTPTPPPPETVVVAAPAPTPATVAGTAPDVDQFVADLTALAETMPVDTAPAAAPSNGSTPNGLVDALNNLANRIPSVTDVVTDGADGDGLTKKQQKAQNMRYYRSVRGPNCPDIIRKKFQEAQSCSPMESQAKIQALFEEFKNCKEDWLSSQIVLREIRSHTTSHQGIWKWMTRDDLVARYSGRTELVERLIKDKVEQGLTKPHPEFPGVPDMLLYNCWLEDTENTIDKHEQSTTLTHDADWGHDDADAGNDGEGGAGAGGVAAGGTVKGGKGRGRGGISAKGDSKGGGKGGKNGKGKGGEREEKPKLPKKEKTPNQLARAAVATANNNILEVSALNMKLTKAGVSEIIRKALIEQLKESEETLRSSKAALEHALAMDADLKDPTAGLTAANLAFKDQIKHANMHLPKPKAKAKAAAICDATA